MNTILENLIEKNKEAFQKYNEILHERSQFGISTYDMARFDNYLDNIIRFAIKENLKSENTRRPAGITLTEWKESLNTILELLDNIEHLSGQRKEACREDFSNGNTFIEYLTKTQDEIAELRQRVYVWMSHYSVFLNVR